MFPSEYRTAAVLGTVQGLGEFLPISSSAHLLVARWLFGLGESSLHTLTYDVALHLGTAAALLSNDWRCWLQLAMAAHEPHTPDGKLFWMLVVASVPGAVAGYLLDDLASTTLRSPLLIAGTLAGVGTVLYLADRFAEEQRPIESIGLRDAASLGLAQAVALVPGVSRSGATIAVGRLRGLRRDDAVRLSFLMAMPISVGAMLFKLKDLQPADGDGPFRVGILVSAGTGLLALRLMHALLSRGRHSFLPFALYRWGLAVVIVAAYARRRWSEGKAATSSRHPMLYWRVEHKHTAPWSEATYTGGTHDTKSADDPW